MSASSITTKASSVISGLLERSIPSISISLRLPVGIDGSGIVYAVPKKKTSHRKKRQRQLSGRNQVNPLNNLNRCPACGNYKRAHTLCMNCVSQIQRLWRLRDNKKPEELEQEKNLDDVDKRILYPGKHESDYEKNLKKRYEYIPSRPRTLPVERGPSSKAPKVARPRK